ncbi:MAG: macro domain-containing protein [Bacilli bacterium]|nr:macro domain-containing protein [Bacilli bacterium]
MDREEVVSVLLNYFSSEMKEFNSIFDGFCYSYAEKRNRLKSYLTVRRPGQLPSDISELIDSLLDNEKKARKCVDVNRLPVTSYSKIGLYIGDITTLSVDAVVDPATPSLLGCFVPGHNCVENTIHSCAGPRLRESCSKIINKLGHEGSIGMSYITFGYHLFSKYVIHSVGPSFRSRPSTLEKDLLRSCYRTALKLSLKYNIKTLAIPPISVGLNGFSSRLAAEIAIQTVEEFMNDHPDAPVVVFCVDKDTDIQSYSSILEMTQNY